MAKNNKSARENSLKGGLATFYNRTKEDLLGFPEILKVGFKYVGNPSSRWKGPALYFLDPNGSLAPKSDGGIPIALVDTCKSGCAVAVVYPAPGEEEKARLLIRDYRLDGYGKRIISGHEITQEIIDAFNSSGIVRRVETGGLTVRGESFKGPGIYPVPNQKLTDDHILGVVSPLKNPGYGIEAKIYPTSPQLRQELLVMMDKSIGDPRQIISYLRA